MINGLGPLIRIISKIERTEEEICLDLSKTEYVSPLFITTLFAYLEQCRNSVIINNIPPYLEAINFGAGIIPDEMRDSEFIAIMESYSRKTFIPIVNFPARIQMTDTKNTILSAIENLIVKQLNIEKNVSVGLRYMIDELVDNITEHSESERGFIFAQAYPRKKYIDICIADNGISLLGSYLRTGDGTISTDSEAMRAANSCVSTKNRPDAENRGFGIFTSKKMLIAGLGGQYLMMSGSSIYLKNSALEHYYSMPDGINIHGTVVAFRLPYNRVSFQYLDFVE